MMPGDERCFPDFFPPLFLLDAEEPDFLAGDCFLVDRFFVFLVVTIVFATTLTGFRSVGPSAFVTAKTVPPAPEEKFSHAKAL